MNQSGYGWRRQTRPDDVDKVRALVLATGFFNAAEVGIAAELVDRHLTCGDASGYRFLFAELGPRLAGYACFGPVDGTRSSYDLYWIVVAPRQQRSGLGKRLLARVERLTATEGGTQIYVETSSRPQYAPTRKFYRSCGYTRQARLRNFYAPGDDKLILVKTLYP